jgi:flagellar biosynthetic protein FliQ
MTAATAVEWFRHMLWTAVLVSAPSIMVAVIVGLLVSIVQAATQVNDQAVGFGPKALAVMVALAVSAHWTLSELTQFTVTVFTAITRIHH